MLAKHIFAEYGCHASGGDNQYHKHGLDRAVHHIIDATQFVTHGDFTTKPYNLPA